MVPKYRRCADGRCPRSRTSSPVPLMLERYLSAEPRDESVLLSQWLPMDRSQELKLFLHEWQALWDRLGPRIQP